MPASVYSRVIEHLSLNVLNVTDCEEMREIMQIYLTEEEAELVLHLGHAPVLHGAGFVARQAGLAPARAKVLLDGLADRGFIARTTVLGRRLYGLAPIMPGFYELTFMKLDSYPEDKDRLRELWVRYKHNHLVPEVSGYRTPAVRVVPVNVDLAVDQQVLAHEDAYRVVERAGTLALGVCACRESTRACDGPRDVCLILNQLGEMLIEGGFAQRATLTEAKRALDRSQQAGLVPLAMNCARSVQTLCSCCGCCCVPFRGLIELNRQGAVAAAQVQAHIDAGACTDCGSCRELCWTAAIEETENGSRVLADRCIGCGLCAAECAAAAITLQPRAGGAPPTPHNPLTLGYRMLDERGKASAMAKALLEELT